MPIRGRNKLDVNLLKATRDHIGKIIDNWDSSTSDPTTTQVASAEKSDLEEKEILILEYIKFHPGVIKQDLVDNPVIDLSRVPIFKYVRNLISYGLISQRATENDQGHHLFINEDSIIIRVMQEIEDFEATYLPLLTNAVQKILSLLKDNKRAASELLTSVISLNTHFLGLYIVSAIFVWPMEIQNKDTVDRLYSIAFNRIKKIEQRISELFAGIDVSMAMAGHIASSWYQLYPFRLDSIYEHFERYDLIKEGDKTIDSLWKIKGPFYPVGGRTLKLRDKYDTDDWRQMIKDQREIEKLQKRKK